MLLVTPQTFLVAAYSLAAVLLARAVNNVLRNTWPVSKLDDRPSATLFLQSLSSLANVHSVICEFLASFVTHDAYATVRIVKQFRVNGEVTASCLFFQLFIPYQRCFFPGELSSSIGLGPSVRFDLQQLVKQTKPQRLSQSLILDVVLFLPVSCSDQSEVGGLTGDLGWGGRCQALSEISGCPVFGCLPILLLRPPHP